MKQKIYNNILVRRSGMDYSPGIRFEIVLVSVDEEKSLTKSNKLENIIRSKKYSAGVAP